MSSVGGKSQTFSIILNTDMWKGTSVGLKRIQIMSLPKRLNYKWYHILINRITFGYLCPQGWTYNVRSENE